MSNDLHQLRADRDTEAVPVGDLVWQGKGIAERLGDPALRWIRLEDRR